jgi:sulfate adenylyltransferase large subunit
MAAQPVVIAPQERRLSLTTFLKRDGEKDLLRFSTAGSVDDGKSTLIGRLLFDAGGAFEDQIEAVKASKINRAGTGHVDFSLLTDGLRAEREQGITIDVAYRYFATPKRKFIIADTPGHEEYTRNMATGASTCDAAVVLVDVRQGPTEQSHRHAKIARLLGIPHVIVAVNKMDLVDYDRHAFDRVRQAFPGANHIPVSALMGENVVQRSTKMQWYNGPSLLELLEDLPNAHRLNEPFRMPVQLVVRPDANFRGYAGQIAAGRVRAGEELTALPSKRTVRVARIVTYDGDLDEAIAPMSVTIVLDREIDLSRGGLLVGDAMPHQSRRISAQAVALLPGGIQAGREYLMKHGTSLVSAHLLSGTLAMNGIGPIEIETTQPLHFDSYRENRFTGAFILIDRVSNNTVAAGMIEMGTGEQAEPLLMRLARGLRRAADKLEEFSQGSGI